MNAASPKQSILKRTIRFGATGLFVTGLHVVIATLLIHYADQNSSIANGVAFCIATVVSYLMHTKWSFSSDLESKNLFRFITVSAVGLALSLAIPLVIKSLGFDSTVGTVAVVVMLPVTNFFLHNFWTYR
jgi:putative flippase GtrA